MTRNPKGYLALVLHAHLPFVRHPEEDYFLEENWLFEAITETYVPLLGVFESLVDDRVDFRLTMSVSPTLAGRYQTRKTIVGPLRLLLGAAALAAEEPLAFEAILRDPPPSSWGVFRPRARRGTPA